LNAGVVAAFGIFLGKAPSSALDSTTSIIVFWVLFFVTLVGIAIAAHFIGSL